LTHDLFKNFAERFDIAVKQVSFKLVDGVFYSSICERDKIEEIIDARTSDAIALARFNALSTYKNILDKAGIYLKANSTETDKDSQEIDDILSNPETLGIKEESNQSGRLYIKHSLQELSELLDQAVLQEDYEKQLK
jgi:bifunctional DNase/RNase